MKAILLHLMLLGAPAETVTASVGIVAPEVVPENPGGDLPVTFERPLPANVRLTPEGDILTGPGDLPLMQRWWFWAIVAGAAAGIVAGGVAITSSDRYTPEGELGSTRTKDWTPL